MNTTTVRCSNGSFIGEDQENIQIWRNIPYAKQPVGPLRWKKPEPAEDDDGTYEAIQPVCIPIVPFTVLEGKVPQGEDCLRLNIYKAKGSDSEKRPVMVWIHGGGFMTESISDPIYDLSKIAVKHPDILFVAVEYRMNIMGFMNFEKVPGGEEFKEAGNLGLLDQLEALRWIQKNIAAFGGDPDNVTIFGESAGSASVTLLPLIDGSEGLFKRIIGQSANVAFTDTKEHGIIVTEHLLNHTGCKTMDDLMALSQEELMEALPKTMASDGKAYMGLCNFPILDGWILPEDRTVLYEMWGDEKRAKIDMMLGSNNDEVKYFIGMQGGVQPFLEALKWVAKKDRMQLSDDERAMMDQFMATLDGEDEVEKFQQYGNDLNFRVPNTLLAVNHARAGGNTYMYYLVKPYMAPSVGAMHATEICFLFDNPYVSAEWEGEPGGMAECEFRDVSKEMWTNFARCGNPSTRDYEWKQFSGDNRQTMVFDETIGMQKDIKGKREDLMMSWCKRLGNGGSKRFC